jgi:hypothetical protein
MLGICLTAVAAILLRRGEIARLASLSVLVPPVVIISFVWAVTLGGESVSKRFETLIAGRPEEVYYTNRGLFIEHTIDVYLPQYPLGAGLGRWGMMNTYFGDNNADPRTQAIWVEVQLTGWLLDGGVPLILLYATALIVACASAARIALNSRRGSLELWGALIFAYDIGAIAVTFNYPLFIGQGGMEFWLLNAALFNAAARAKLAEKRPPPRPRPKPLET